MIPNNQFFYGSGSGGVTVLQDWYDSLAVKPSEGLWTDLKIMADGMSEDGDWDEMDLFGVIAGLETDEQRLKPFKTTSGDNCVVEGAPGLSVNGIDNPLLTNVNGLNLKWNPTDNGVKYALNNAYIGGFGITKTSSLTIQYIMGSILDVTGTIYQSNISIQATTTSIANVSSSINQQSFLSSRSKTGLLDTIKSFSTGLQRIDSLNLNQKINDNSYGRGSLSNFMPTLDFGFFGYFYQDDVTPLYFEGNSDDVIYGRAYIAGSSLIDHDRVAARLNTFFAARGLSIANY